MFRKFNKNIKGNKYLKIFLKFPINSFISFIFRFLSLYFFVDLLNYDYNAIYLLTYVYIVFQSYFVQKYFVQRSSEKKFVKFFVTNILLGLIEYTLIYIIQLFFYSYYSSAFIFSAIIIYFFRFYIYTFIIFKKLK